MTVAWLLDVLGCSWCSTHTVIGFYPTQRLTWNPPERQLGLDIVTMVASRNSSRFLGRRGRPPSGDGAMKVSAILTIWKMKRHVNSQ